MKIADNKSLTATVASLVAVFALGAAGCSDRTEQAASNAAQGAAQDAQNHAAAADQAVENAGKEVAQETREAGQAVANAGKEVAQETREAGQAVAEGTREVGRRADEALGGVAENAQDLGAAVSLTPKIKNALVADKTVDAAKINVETVGDKNTVYLKGNVATAQQKERATQIARKELTDAKSNFKLQNDLVVGGAAASR